MPDVHIRVSQIFYWGLMGGLIRGKLRFVLIICLLNVIIIPDAASQCASLDFTIPPTNCIAQNINFSAPAGYQNYTWDFCAGDLELTPVSSILNNGFGGASFKVELVEQNGVYYGFLLAKNTGKLYRLDFGSNINNTPILVDLGGLGVNSSTWRVIEVVKENNVFYGFIMDANVIYRISFGNSLSNPPSAAQVVFSGAPIVSPIDMVIVEDGTSKFLFVANLGNNTLVRMTFDSFANAPAHDPAKDITVGGAIYVSGISFIRECSTWYCIATGFANSRVYNIAFNGGLDDLNPNITSFSLGNVTGVAVANDNGQFYAFIQQQSANKLYRLRYGSSLANAPTIDELTNIGLGGDFWALALYNVKSDWIGISTDGSGSNTYRIAFPNLCFSAVSNSSTRNPIVPATTAGDYNVSLKAQDAAGNLTYKGHALHINGTPAPDIDFSTQNICVNNPVNFTSINSLGNVVAYHWTFGDAATGSGTTTTHSYSSSGTYVASLVADGSNGCSNYAEKTLSIFNQPVANFNLPATTPICTNQDYTLTNTSSFDPGSSPVWEWRVNGALVSGQQDLNINFNSPVAQNIKLKAIMPGCESEMIKSTAAVVPGPAVNFTFDNKCLGLPTNFTNTTVGTVDAGYAWAFGDAATSTQPNPIHTYASTGSYQVTLTGSNSAGCNNFKTTTVQIYSVPQPDFAISAPPFSCTNVASPFQNLTPVLTDSNITNWFWQFNDPAGGASNQQSPSYVFTTAGTYSVTLTATSDAGCVKAVTKPTTISVSPIADFSVGSSCLNLPTKFTDQSSGSIQSRNWQIGPATFTTQNPSYTFTATGNFPAILTVNSPNGCTSVKAKTIIVPVPPALNFTAANLCATKDAIFTDVTSSPQDVVAGWNWNFDGNAGSGNPATFNFASAGSYNVKMTTTHASGCKYTLSKNVSINTSPIAGFTASPDAGEPPLTVKFTNTSQQASSYVWKFYDRSTSTSTNVSPVYTFVALGDYSAELTATNNAGCSDVITTPIKVLVPSIDLALTNLSLVIDPQTAKFRAVVTIRNNGNVSVSFADVSLILSDKAVVNETVPIDLKPGLSVTKTLSFTVSPDANAFLCAEINSEKDIQPGNNKQCIKFDSGDYFFNPYPNPTAGPVQVDWMSSVAGTSRVIIHDNMGRKVFDWQTSAIAGLNRATLDLSLFQTGLYYITVDTGKSKKTTRLLIQ